MRQIVLDTETTGLRWEDGHRIIEIGCVELIDRKLTGNHFHQYFNPQRDVDPEALAVHGISNDFLNSQPFFIDHHEKLFEFLAGAELIIHNAAFDVSFINYEISLINKNWKCISEYCKVLDTLLLARQLHVGQRNSLDALCKRYNVDNKKRELHGALLDAHLLCNVYLAMTGGQSNLFDVLEENEVINDANNITISTNKYNLIVLKASEDELKAHSEYLQFLGNQGKCLWEEVQS